MRFIYILFMLVVSVPVVAQNISGSIVSDEGEPLYNITVSLSTTNYHTQTDKNGKFTLRNVAPGVYTFVATAISYSANKQNVIVTHEDIVLNFKLIRATKELREVMVTTFKNIPKDQASIYAAKLPVKNIENPQVINLVSNQIITEQAVLDYNSALKNVPGITKSWGSVNGFYYSRGFNTRNYMRNGVSAYATADLDVADMEQMQVVKGPSGTLFGSPLVSFGGLINRITKKPFDSALVELQFQGGSYDLGRFSADVNTPLAKDKSVLFRLNAAHTYLGSFQDAGFLRSTFVTPSIYYKVNEKLTINLDAEIYNREATSQQQITPTGTGEDQKGASHPSSTWVDYRRAYSNNNITLKDPTQSFYGQIRYKLSDSWTFQTNVIRTRSENTGNYLTFSLPKGDSLLVRNIAQFPTTLVTTTQVQQNFNNDFKIGSFRNRLLLGLDYYQNTSNSSSNTLWGWGRPSFDTLNLKSSMPNYNMLTPQMIGKKLEIYVPDYVTSSIITYAAYASDVINLTDNLSAMLSLRLDRYVNKGTTDVASKTITGNYNQTALSPKFGLVYQVAKDVFSIFGNYMNGIQNVAPVLQPDGTTSVFKPQYANQIEAGFKTEMARGLLSATISYYDIRVRNTLRQDEHRPNFQVQDGTQFSKGIEIDLLSRPVNGLLANAGFSYNDSKITSEDQDVEGLRDASSGPKTTANFYVSYNFPTIRLGGLGIGFGGNYSSRNFIVNTRSAGFFYLDSYTVFNAGIFYNKPKYRLAVNIDNLTDHQYYTGGFGNFTPAVLRSLVVSLSIRF